VNQELIVVIYVDDNVIASKDLQKIVNFKKQLGDRFKTKDLGEVNFVLKTRVEKTHDGGWKIHQQNYIDDLVKFYELKNEKPVYIPIQPNHKLTTDLLDDQEQLRAEVDTITYRQAIGKLMYLRTCNRPDICYTVSVLSRFMTAPRETHRRFVKQLLRNVKSTRDYALIFPRSNSMTLTGYSDSDHAGDLGDRKSTSGFVFILDAP